MGWSGQCVSLRRAMSGKGKVSGSVVLIQGAVSVQGKEGQWNQCQWYEVQDPGATARHRAGRRMERGGDTLFILGTEEAPRCRVSWVVSVHWGRPLVVIGARGRHGGGGQAWPAGRRRGTQAKGSPDSWPAQHSCSPPASPACASRSSNHYSASLHKQFLLADDLHYTLSLQNVLTNQNAL